MPTTEHSEDEVDEKIEQLLDAETKGKILYHSHGRFQRMLLWEKVKRMHMSGGKSL